MVRVTDDPADVSRTNFALSLSAEHAPAHRAMLRSKLNANYERVYADLNSGNWWRDEEQSTGMPCDNSYLLVIVLSSDATHMTATGWSLHPCYLTVGNIPRWWRQKQTGWTLVGFYPVVRASKAFTNRVAVTRFRRDVGHWCFEQMTKPLVTNKFGFSLEYTGPGNRQCIRYVFPRMPFLQGDDPEHCNLSSGTKPSAMSRMPCTACLLQPRVDGLFHNAPLRNHEFVRSHMDSVSRRCTLSKDDCDSLSLNGR